MKALVIYESMYGNTAEIAAAIAAALQADILKAGQATPVNLSGVDLLVIGSPTHGFRPTEDTTSFIKLLSKDHLAGVRVAAFDTRAKLDTIKSSILRFMVDKGGYAAPKIAKTLAKKGAKLVINPEGFFVLDTEGPLEDGEVERAAEWAKSLPTL
jgi:flavodoxin I